MKTKQAVRPAVTSPLQQLKQGFAALESELDPATLSRRIVEAIGAQQGIVGARMWRLVDGASTVWHEAGQLPPPDAERAQQSLTEGHSASPDRRESKRWAGVLGTNSEAVALVEAFGDEPLNGQTRETLGLLVQFAGVALLNSERRQVVAELSTVAEAAQQLNSTLDLGNLISVILQLATRHSGADRGTVFLLDKEQGELWSLVGLGLEQHEIRLPATKGIVGWVATNGKTLNLADAYEDQRFEREFDRRLGYRTKSLLCLPIRDKDGNIAGVLELLNKRTGPFTIEDERLLNALSVHVALALENAQLHRERLAKQRMERELSLARSIQIGLLPESPPELQGFDIAVLHRPSSMVGGDYYDFVRLGPETLLAVVADVEGKGVSSALVMANLQATLRALSAHVHGLERLVGSLNHMMWADTRAQKYLTMFVGLLDERQRSLHYVNAGHIPPAVLRADGTTTYLREGGLVVGLFPSVKYERGCVRLEPGDVFVTCTDGITEAMNAAGDEYGIERLLDTVNENRAASAEEILATVMASVDRFSRGGTHEDDRVLLVLKVLQTVEKPLLA